MSPILIRPVREQLEHDRLIRFLQTKYQKKFEVVANAGDAQAGPVKLSRPAPFFPDLVLLSGGKIAGLVEIETAESTNNLEALAQWQHFSRARVPFYLYVPVATFDAAQRFCEAYQIGVTEIWTYRAVHEGFDLVRIVNNPSAVANTPKSVSVVGKLLPPVTPVHVEPEKEAKILELTNLVEMANRSFKAAASKASPAAAARAAAKAAAKAAAAKPASAAGKTSEPAPAGKSGKASPASAAPEVPAVKTAKNGTAMKSAKPAKPVAPPVPVKVANKTAPATKVAKTTAQVAKATKPRPAKAAAPKNKNHKSAVPKAKKTAKKKR